MDQLQTQLSKKCVERAIFNAKSVPNREKMHKCFNPYLVEVEDHKLKFLTSFFYLQEEGNKLTYYKGVIIFPGKMTTKMDDVNHVMRFHFPNCESYGIINIENGEDIVIFNFII